MIRGAQVAARIGWLGAGSDGILVAMGMSDATRVTQAIHYLEENWRDQPGLDDVAAAVGLSGSHFQRLFRRWAGVSPKRFLQYLTAEHARGLLRESSNVLDAAYETGLSGPGRLR